MKFKSGNKIKTLALALTLIVSVGSLAGCGNKVNDKNEAGQTIVYVGNWPKSGKALENRTAIENQFEEANADVAIEPDPWVFDRKSFYPKAAGGQLPTVYEVAYTEAPEIIESGYSADLTDALKKHGFDGKFNQDILDIVTKDGKIWAFPMNAYMFGLGCNMDIMKQAGLVDADGTPKQPKDWFEMAEMAVQIKEKTGKPGFFMPTANNCGGWMFMSIAWSFGVDFMEQNSDGKWQATFNTPEAIEALEFIKSLKWDYDVMPSNSLIDLTEYYKIIGTDGAGMYIVPGDYSGSVVQYAMDPNKLGIMAMPKGPKAHVTLLGGAVHGVSNTATDDQIDGAVRWFKTLYNFEATDEYKETIQRRYDTRLSQNQHIGIKTASIWNENSEGLAYDYAVMEEKSTTNPNHVRLYNEFITNCPAEIRAEEPVCCQELYQILDGCIQEVLTNKDADCATLIEKASADFQANYLDNLTY